MDIRGLILINSAGMGGAEEFAFPEVPPALLDVAGQTPLQRAAERLRHFGVSQVSAVIEGKAVPEILENKMGLQYVVATRQRFWRVAENSFNEMALEGAELVLVVRLGAYAEIDFERLVQFHLESACRVSQLGDGAANLDVFCISASRRNDAASLFRSQLRRSRSECPLLVHGGYVNPLATAADLRQFAIDILMLKTITRPAGEEARPGVWVAPGALIEKGARLLAPSFIGRQAKVRFGAVITRCSSVEHHAEIDCGTVVENSSVLPFSYVGAGLDVAHCVVGMGRVANLRRKAAVRIRDGKLVAHIAATSSRKLLSSAARVITFLPKKVWQGLSGGNKVPRPELAAALRHTAPTRSDAARLPAPGDAKTADEFAGNLAVARRYGNQ